MKTKIKIDPEVAIRYLTPDEALDLLDTHIEKRKKRVHTLLQNSFIMMGCDMDLTSIKKKLKACKADEISLTGENMKRMGHGVAYWEGKYGWTFLETDKDKLEAIYKKRKIK